MDLVFVQLEIKTLKFQKVRTRCKTSKVRIITEVDNHWQDNLQVVKSTTKIVKLSFKKFKIRTPQSRVKETVVC